MLVRCNRRLGLAANMLGLCAAEKTKPWHEREDHEQSNVDGAGDFVSASNELSDGLILKNHCKP